LLKTLSILERSANAIPSVAALKIRLFMDDADLSAIHTMAANSLIRGFITNPTLMCIAGITS